MPLAARVSGMHTCPMQNLGTPPVPYVEGPITTGATNVLIGKIPAARIDDSTAHGGKIASGYVNVLIGG